MSANQMTLTMIRDSAPDFECQPIENKLHVNEMMMIMSALY
jgi:hypothetical protein